MPVIRASLLTGFLVLDALCAASAGNVLFIITSGPQSHMYGMRKIAVEAASRQHNVLVSVTALLLVARQLSITGRPSTEGSKHA